jgi:hypothetical protein
MRKFTGTHNLLFFLVAILFVFATSALAFTRERSVNIDLETLDKMLMDTLEPDEYLTFRNNFTVYTDSIDKEKLIDILKAYANFRMNNNSTKQNENIRFNYAIEQIENNRVAISTEQLKAAVDAVDRTEDYISNIDLAKLKKDGCDYNNTELYPSDSVKSEESLTDYDYTRLALIEEKLQNVDRRRVLQYLFERITQDAHNETEKQLKILEFLDQVSNHRGSVDEPQYPDGTMACDPLALIELHEMKCGQVSRIAVDLYLANGYNARVVQLAAHVIAEVEYENDWHYFDADLFGGGLAYLSEDGTIPSFSELVPEYIDNVAPVYFESATPATNDAYPSYNYMTKDAYSNAGHGAMLYIKTASFYDELNELYGWNCYKTVASSERSIVNIPKRYMPSGAIFNSIFADSENNSVRLSYQASDSDGDLVGYRIFISTTSREWQYAEFYGNKKYIQYWNNRGGWQPEMYEHKFEPPPSDVILLETRKEEIDIKLPNDGVYFITVMPFDKYGESIGKELYYVSNELKIAV